MQMKCGPESDSSSGGPAIGPVSSASFQSKANLFRRATVKIWISVLQRRDAARNCTMPRARPQRIFLLSPAYAGGERARMIMSERAQFALARQIRSTEGATIAEVFTFLSGL